MTAEEWSYRGLNSAEEIKVVLAGCRELFIRRKLKEEDLLDYTFLLRLRAAGASRRCAALLWEAYQGHLEGLGGDAANWKF